MGTSILYNLVSRGGEVARYCWNATLLGRAPPAARRAPCACTTPTTVNADLAWQSLKIFQNWDDIIGGGDCGFVKTGYMVFVPPDALAGLEHNIAVQQAVGIDTRIVSNEEARELAPMFHHGGGEAFAWEPESGHADPSGTAMAYANRARELGASVALESPALDVEVRNGPSRRGPDRKRAVRNQTPRWSQRDRGRRGSWQSWATTCRWEATRHEVFLLRRPMDRLPFHPGGSGHGQPDLLQAGGLGPDLGRQWQRRGGRRPRRLQPALDHRPTFRMSGYGWRGGCRTSLTGRLFTGYAGLYTSTPRPTPHRGQGRRRRRPLRPAPASAATASSCRPPSARAWPSLSSTAPPAP